MYRNYKNIDRIIFGRGCFNQLDEIVSQQRSPECPDIVFLVDDVHQNKPIKDRIPLQDQDLLIWVNVDDEPKTKYVDKLRDQVRDAMQQHNRELTAGIVGIGGGSTMDLAKAVSLMLTNPGSSSDYQGWDLITQPAVWHCAVPTLSGTGSEVSRTTVLTGPTKKLGINSDYTVFDQAVLDPELTVGIPREQWFWTGMDCYIHCVESLTGHYLNAFAQAYGEKSEDLCKQVFLEDHADSDDKLMMASFFGGMSIAYSQVGICHALAYGLSFQFGIHHGIGNSIAFEYLEEFYPEGVAIFRNMMKKNDIKFPRGVLAGATAEQIDRMTDICMGLTPLMENALGKDWQTKLTRDHVRDLYRQM